VRETVVDDGKALALDRCFVTREGNDVTLIGWGAAIGEVMESAEMLSADGIEAEVIDVATLKLLDFETVAASVEKTGRCVIVHEAPGSGGFGAEIAARLASAGLMNLLAPIERVAGWDTVMPLPRLEEHYMPSTDRILATAERLMDYA